MSLVQWGLNLNGQLESRSIWTTKQLLTPAQMQAFLDGTVAVEFSVAVEDRYGFIARTVLRFGCARLQRVAKAAVLRVLQRVSGYSRQQLTRLGKRGCERGELNKRYRGGSG